MPIRNQPYASLFLLHLLDVGLTMPSLHVAKAVSPTIDFKLVSNVYFEVCKEKRTTTVRKTESGEG